MKQRYLFQKVDFVQPKIHSRMITVLGDFIFVREELLSDVERKKCTIVEGTPVHIE